jgi:uncharacterized repeat protein (TIGR01451 family)
MKSIISTFSNKNRYQKSFLLTILLAVSGFYLQGQSITGTAYLDLNLSGVKDVNESGLAGITVTAYNAAGATAATTATASNGTYTLSGLTNGIAYRVEFTGIPAGYYTGPKGSGSGTSVQFVTASATNVNLGVNYPSDYCQANPNLVVPCYDAGASTTSGFDNVTTHPAIIAFPSTATGSTSAPTNPAPTKNVAVSKVGSVWGTAFKKDTKRMFFGTMLKRHIDLGEYSRPNTSSVQTIDGVYMADYNGLTGTYAGGFRLQGVNGIDLGSVNRFIKSSAVSASSAADDNALSSVNRQSRDLDAFAKIGKVGMGDVAISEDMKYLWIVNLNQKALIKVDISNQALLPTTGGTISGSLVNQYNIDFSSLGACSGNFRPWALSMYHGRGYVGVVCDAASGTAANLKAYVLSFDPANVGGGFTKEFEMVLNYNREQSAWPTSQNASYRSAAWRPWIDTWSLPSLSGEFSWPQPILSNIEFTQDGSMTLGFMDRAGMQFDYNQLSPISVNTKLLSIDAGGDIVQVCKTGGVFKVEGDAGCVIDTDPGAPPALSMSNDGPKNVGEFYYQDKALSSTNHLELTLGGLVMLTGTQQVVSTAFDPITENFNQGLHWYSTVTGLRSSQYQVTPNGISKGALLGEPDLMCNPAPIEIGNFVWKDTDGDGVQDAGEPPLVGVTIKLYAADGTTVLATAVSDANGQYYFSSAAGTSTANNIYGLGLTENTTYYLKVTALGSHSSVAGLTLTGVTTGGTAGLNAGTSIANNDATVLAGVPSVQLKTGTFGQNNHTYDFGFGGCAVTASASATPTTVCGGQTISLAASGGASGATYAWSGPNSFSSTSQNPTISGAASTNAGVYTVTVTNSPGCSATATASVSVTSISGTASNIAGCLGEAISLIATGPAGATYSWAGPNSYTSSSQNPVISPSVAANAGVYAVQVTSNGCTTNANTTVVLTSVMASATANTPLCTGSTLQLAASSGGTSYNWSGPNSFASTLQNPTVTAATTAATGTYTVTVTGGSCAGTATVSVTVNATPVATVTKGAVCDGEQIQLHATGGTTYAWSGPNGFSSTSANPVINPAVGANTGTYSVTITGASSACSASVPVNVFGGTVMLTNYAEIIYADQTVTGVNLANNSTTEADDALVTSELITCTKPTYSLSATSATCNGASANSNAQISVTGITNGTRIGWSTGTTYSGPDYDVATTLSGGTHTITGLNNPSDSIYYVVRIYNGGQCCLKDTIIKIYAAACAAAVNNGPVCLGSTIQLTATGGLSYAWSGPNSYTSTSQNPSIAGATAAMSGTYTVTVTSGPNTSTASTTLSITIPPASATANSPVVTGQPINLVGGGGATYSWSGPNGFSSTLQSPVISSAVLASGGTYTVTATDASGCTATATVAVTVLNASCSQAVTAAANTPLCEGENLLLTATPTIAGANYSWSGPNGYVSTDQNPVINAATDDHHTGTYTVSITTTTGCTGTSTVAVTVGLIPETPVIAGTTQVSVGGTISLSAGGDPGHTYDWTLPDASTMSGQTINIPNASLASHDGIYTVIVTSAEGCSNTASLGVDVLPNTHLILAKTADKTTVTAGSNETVVFTITLTNTGSISAPDVLVKDKLPSGFSYVSSSASTGTYDPITGIWNVGTAPLGNTTLTITATIQ